MSITRRSALRHLAAGLAFAAPTVARAQTWPRQITIVVPFPPGASNDTFARLIAQKLGPKLGITVVVDNRPGASGNIGAGFVARSEPNGATLLLTSSSFPASVAIQTGLPFDAQRDLVPVAQLAKGAMIVAVNPGAPYRTVADIITAARAQPGRINFGSAGVGSINHMANEMLAHTAQVEMTHIPYRGISGAITDLIAGRIDMAIASFPSIAGQIGGGNLRGIAVTSPEPSPFARELPPVAQSVAGYAVELWWGMYAPANTPQPLVEAINTEIRAIIGDEEMRGRFAHEGAEPTPITAPEFAAIMANDLAMWRTIARERNIRPE